MESEPHCVWAPAPFLAKLWGYFCATLVLTYNIQYSYLYSYSIKYYLIYFYLNTLKFQTYNRKLTFMMLFMFAFRPYHFYIRLRQRKIMQIWILKELWVKTSSRTRDKFCYSLRIRPRHLFRVRKAIGQKMLKKTFWLNSLEKTRHYNATATAN
jgi:hypothetical protein